MKRILVLLAALLLGGCDLTSPEIELVTDAPPTALPPNESADYAIPAGTAIAFTPYLSRQEIEGGPTHLKIEDVRSDDPTIVRIERATREFQIQYPNTNEHALVMIGLAPGRTTIRLYDGDDEEGSYVVEVVPQGS